MFYLHVNGCGSNLKTCRLQYIFNGRKQASRNNRIQSFDRSNLPRCGMNEGSSASVIDHDMIFYPLTYFPVWRPTGSTHMKPKLWIVLKCRECLPCWFLFCKSIIEVIIFVSKSKEKHTTNHFQLKSNQKYKCSFCFIENLSAPSVFHQINSHKVFFPKPPYFTSLDHLWTPGAVRLLRSLL